VSPVYKLNDIVAHIAVDQINKSPMVNIDIVGLWLGLD